MSNNKQFFFSIAIPTFNRANLLKRAISSFLIQDFQNFEIVISDNNSTDNTKEIIESFRDSRIIYSKNNENIGFISNVRKVILMAQGKYIITHGDDDMLLFSDSLRKIHDLLKERNYGFIRLNYLSKDRQNKDIANIWINKSFDVQVAKNAQSLNLLSFLEELSPSFLSGLVFKNERITSDDFIYSEIAPWIKLLFRLSKEYGVAFMHDNYIISSWSEGDISKVYNIDKKNRLYFENYIDCIVSELLNKSEADEYMKLYFERFKKEYIYFFPALKYFTNNKNLKAYKNRLFYLNRNLKNDLSFWFYYFISFYTPKFIISFLRRYIHLIRPDSSRDIKEIKEIDVIKKKFEILTNNNMK